MVSLRHWSVSLWRDPDDVSQRQILSPDKTEWHLISATLCGWRRCFMADQLWLMKRIREEEEDSGIDDYHDSPGPKTSRWWKILVPLCLYCLNCTKIGQLIIRKIIKIVATRRQILRLKCTKFDFSWGSAPDPPWGSLHRSPRPPCWIEGAYF